MIQECVVADHAGEGPDPVGVGEADSSRNAVAAVAAPWNTNQGS